MQLYGFFVFIATDEETKGQIHFEKPVALSFTPPPHYCLTALVAAIPQSLTLSLNRLPLLPKAARKKRPSGGSTR